MLVGRTLGGLPSRRLTKTNANDNVRSLFARSRGQCLGARLWVLQRSECFLRLAEGQRERLCRRQERCHVGCPKGVTLAVAGIQERERKEQVPGRFGLLEGGFQEWPGGVSDVEAHCVVEVQACLHCGHQCSMQTCNKVL